MSMDDLGIGLCPRYGAQVDGPAPPADLVCWRWAGAQLEAGEVPLQRPCGRHRGSWASVVLQDRTDLRRGPGRDFPLQRGREVQHCRRWSGRSRASRATRRRNRPGTTSGSTRPT